MRARRLFRSERGAVFVQIGISIFVLMAFNVFVLDYGVLWVGRRQAQNAADAGALAGAVARGYDDFATPPVAGGPATEAARRVAEANPVWSEAGAVEVSYACPPGVSGRCTQVDVYRNAAHSNPLPTFFGPILGIYNQGVRATATARTGTGNATDCLRPIAFADDWAESGVVPDEYNSYDANGVPLTVGRDSYTPPSLTLPGRTVIPDDVGNAIVWQADRPTLTTAPITRNLVVAMTLPGPYPFEVKLKDCSGHRVQLGQTLPVEIPPPGDTEFALAIMISRDPGATWNADLKQIENSCAPGCAPMSPRWIPVALYDPDKFQKGRSSAVTSPGHNWTDVGCPTNDPCVTITNIVGLFVHGTAEGPGPHGHLLRYPGMALTSAPMLTDEASWLVTTNLIR